MKFVIAAHWVSLRLRTRPNGSRVSLLLVPSAAPNCENRGTLCNPCAHKGLKLSFPCGGGLNLGTRLVVCRNVGNSRHIAPTSMTSLVLWGWR